MMQRSQTFISIVTLLAATIIQADGSSNAIAQDPDFQRAWQEYQQQTPTAQAHQMPLSSFPLPPVKSSAHTDNHASALRVASRIPSQTPSAICQTIRNRVKYAPDAVEHWQSVDETWRRGAGDCEDYSIAVQSICSTRGIKSDIYIFRPKGGGEAHAVVIGRWNGKYWMSSNGQYQEAETLSAAYTGAIEAMQWKSRDVDIYCVTDVKTRSLRVVERMSRT